MIYHGFAGSRTSFVTLHGKAGEGSKYYILKNKPNNKTPNTKLSIAFTLFFFPFIASYLLRRFKAIRTDHNLQMSNIRFVDGNTKADLLILNALVAFERLCARNGLVDVGLWDKEERVFGECKGET